MLAGRRLVGKQAVVGMKERDGQVSAPVIFRSEPCPSGCDCLYQWALVLPVNGPDVTMKRSTTALGGLFVGRPIPTELKAFGPR